MTTFTIPYDDEPLIKAVKPPKPPKPPNLGSWQGLPIIAIGKNGGKIVGHDSKGKPIYASSNQAKKLADIKKQEGLDKVSSVGEWLLTLGIPNKVKGNSVYVQPAAAELLQEQFGVTGINMGKAIRISFGSILAHVGEPLKPSEEDAPGWAATISSGEAEEDPFPDLSTLKEIPAGKFAGSGYHGVNRLFVDPSGNKFVFKDSSQLIARAEEAAARVGRLIVGKDKIPPVKMVEIEGKPGALIKVVPGDMMTEKSHSNPPGKLLDKHRKDLARHFVVDWLISNHDAHGGNFLTQGDQLIGIDKGQAWKFFGQDEPLDPNYQPNEHSTVYKKFWAAVQNGTIDLATILPALGEALDAAEKITPEQYESIIGPYLGEVSKDISGKLVDRLNNLRSQLEGYLSKLMGKPVKIPKEHADNFETMPEVESAKEGEPALTINVPGKPSVIEGGPKEAVVTEAVPGWPATKGKVTINHPGEPSPGGKWPKGYPGPGYSASITYKKQKYTIEFKTGPDGKAQVDVYYPDGTKKTWDSPNLASDSMYLFHQGLPLTMSATEKKAKGISLPAKKAFGITAFKTELMQAHAGELPPGAMNPQELEQAGVIPKGATELSAEAVIGKLPDGPIDDWEELPQEVKEAALANTWDIGANYPAAIPPGLPYKATEEGKPVIYVPVLGAYPGTVDYIGFDWEDGKLISTAMHSAIVDSTHNLDQNATLQSIKKDMLADLPQTADEQIGPPPAVELPKEAKVPPEAPKHHAGPLAPGTSLTVQKKFPWGKGDVMLLAHSDGYDVSFFDGEGNIQTQTFKTLSAASDWLWVNLKGYPNAEEYKKATGKKKVPSGGGWKFWGIKSKPKPAPAPKIPKAPDGSPGMESLDVFPAPGALENHDEGTVLVWDEAGVPFKLKKTGPGSWDFSGPHGTLNATLLDVVNPDFWKDAQNIKIKVPKAGDPKPPEPAPTVDDLMQQLGVAPAPEPVTSVKPVPAPSNWETMPEVPAVSEIVKMPVGTELEFGSDTTEYRAKKLPNGTWEVSWTEYTGDEESQVQSSYDLIELLTLAQENMEKAGGTFELSTKVTKPPDAPPAVPDYKDPLAGMPTTWSPLPAPLTIEFQKSQPEGTQIKVGNVVWVKTGEGLAKWKNLTSGTLLTMFGFQDLLGKEALQMRMLDTDKFQAQQKATEVPLTPPAPPAAPAIKPIDVDPDDPQAMINTVNNLEPGESVSWEESEGTYWIEKNPDGTFTVYHESNVGNKYDFHEDDAEAALSYFSYDEATDTKLTSTAPPVAEPEAVAIKATPEDVEAAIAAMKPGDELIWSEGPKSYKLIKKADGQYKLEDWDTGKITMDHLDPEEVGGVIAWSANPTSFELYAAYEGAPPPVAAPSIQTTPVSATKPDVKAMLEAMKPGDGLVWDDVGDGVTVMAIKGDDGKFTLVDYHDEGLIDADHSVEDLMTLPEGIHWDSAENFRLKTEGPPPVVPAEANWETMPEQTTDPGYASQLAALPIGAQLKMVSKGTGKVWTIVKDYATHYTVTGPTGNVSEKGEVGAAAFLINMKDIQFKAKPNPVTPEVAAAVEAVTGPTPVEADKESIAEAVHGLVPGDYLEWEETDSIYRIYRNTDGSYKVMNWSTGEKFESNTNADVAGSYVDYFEAKNIKVKSKPGAPSKKHTKTVEMAVEAAIIDEMTAKYGSKFFRKKSNKPSHTNIFLNDPGGATILAELAKKYGLNIANKGGVPKKYYGKWMITVPSIQLGLKTTQEVPVDGPIPDSAEPSPELAEEKEEAKWAAVGAIGGKAGQLEGMGYTFKWPDEVLPDDNVVEPGGPMSGTAASKIEAKGLVLVKGKKPKPKPELSPEQKAQVEKAKKVGEWLKKNPGVPGDASLVLAHFQTLFDKFKPGMRAWARDGGNGTILLGSPDGEFAELMAEMATHGLKAEKVDTPLGTFWRVKTADLAKALPGQPADTVTGPDGKTYPKGTTWTEEEIKTTTAQLLESEPGFYKITDHNTDPNLKVLKVQGTDEEKRKLLVKMANKHMLTYDTPVQGGANWLIFVPTAELEKVAKTETQHNAQVPPQPKVFASAPYPTMGAVKGGEPGVSNRADLANMPAIKVGMTGHAVRMGAPGVFRNGQVYVRKVKDKDGKVHYEVHGELEQFNTGKSSLSPSSSVPMPSAMKGDSNAHNFEEGTHSESGKNIYSSNGYTGETASGSKIGVYGSSYAALRNTFTVRIPEGADLEAELGEALGAIGVDAEEAMRQHTSDDERILIKSAIIKNKIGPKAWRKLTSNPDFPPKKRFDEAWLDAKLKALGVTPEVVASARFQTTIANHQSVVIDDPEIEQSKDVKFVYIGMGQTSLLNQIVDGSGWCARTHYAMNGQVYGGASPGADLSSGGANSSFCRVGHVGNNGDSWGLACHGWKVILHKRVLGRTNWRFYTSDSYGTTTEQSSSMKPREGVMGSMSASNEICFDVGVGVQDVAGIAAPGESEKQDMIAKLKAKGITEINGIQLDDFIQVVDNESRTKTANKFVGLQPGVLP